MRHFVLHHRCTSTAAGLPCSKHASDLDELMRALFAACEVAIGSVQGTNKGSLTAAMDNIPSTLLRLQ